MSRFRKALWAGAGAAVAAAGSGLGQALPSVSKDEAAALIGSALAAALVVGWGAWRIPNAGTVDPKTGRVQT